MHSEGSSSCTMIAMQTSYLADEVPATSYAVPCRPRD